MRSPFLLGLVIASVYLFSHTLLGKREGVAPQLSVKQQFDSEINNLEKNLNQSKKIEDRLKALSKTETQLESLRKRNPLQVEPDEFYMDQVQTSLAKIPRGKDFKKEECIDYKTQILAKFDPKGEDKPSEPIAKTFSVLEKICR